MTTIEVVTEDVDAVRNLVTGEITSVAMTDDSEFRVCTGGVDWGWAHASTIPNGILQFVGDVRLIVCRPEFVS